MNTYDESFLLSGRKTAAFGGVVLLHLVFGYALYSELAGPIRKAFEAPPLDLTPMAQTIKETIKPPLNVPLNSSVRLRVTPPELPPLTAAEPYVPADTTLFEPPQTISAPPQPGTTSKVRMDPKHPLRIGEAYYPDASRRANEMGRCLVKVTVASDGSIVAAAIQSSTGFERLDQACLNAVKGQRMLPAMQDGKAIESSISIPILWNLSDR